MNTQPGRVLVPGEGGGEVLHLEADLSFWGAIDPLTGNVIDHRHPQYGECITGKVITLRRSIGSSSGSAVRQRRPRRGGPDRLLRFLADAGGDDRGEPAADPVPAHHAEHGGAVVAREMGYGSIPVLLIDSNLFSQLPAHVEITLEGRIVPGTH